MSSVLTIPYYGPHRQQQLPLLSTYCILSPVPSGFGCIISFHFHSHLKMKVPCSQPPPGRHTQPCGSAFPARPPVVH